MKKKLGIVMLFLYIFAVVLGYPRLIQAAESAPNYEFRGAWVSTAYNIDWPSSSGLSIANQKSEIDSMFNELKSTNFNAVLFQVRSMGDAFYTSNYSPWSKYITGTLGQNPGYDPLRYAIDAAKARNLEFHAWFNPFRISTDLNFNKDNYLAALPELSPLKHHPEWIVNYEGYHWLNLAEPAVRKYVVDLILEVAGNYSIDGVHLDDYFYPYPRNGVEFPDELQYQQYGQGYNSKGDWRRDNVNKFVSELSQRLRQRNSSIKLGISPFGIWRNGADVGGSDTNGLSSYDTLYCDSVNWIDKEWIDYIVPQIYWNIGHSTADYAKLVKWWSEKAKNKNVHLYIGQAAYKIGSGGAWDNVEEIPNQIRLNRSYDFIKGSSFFSARDILENKLGIKDNLKANLYSATAQIPPMFWKTEKSDVSISYRSHVQNVGWQGTVYNNDLTGSTGESQRLEAIRINLLNTRDNLNITYRAHVQNEGWQSWVSSGETSGSEGKNQRLEAIQIKLTGADAFKYKLEYQAHVQDYGWMPWVSNGETAGTTGQSKRVEAMRIRIVPKNILGYESHIQNIGWQGVKYDGEISGTEGRGLRMEAIKINSTNLPQGVSIKYRAHVQDIGWQPWVGSGQIAGTEGRSLRIEALEVQLEGINADKYKIQYQAHVQDYGWMSWVENGQIAGTTGQSKRIEAVRIKISGK